MYRWVYRWIECFGGDVNRMVCGIGWSGVVGLGRVMWVGVTLSLGLGLVLGDCVWCVLLPETVANATNSSKSTPPVSHN